MLEPLRQQVCRANRRLVDMGLVFLTWGNVSGLDRDRGLVVIKPSGVDYDTMTPEQMAVLSLDNGETVEGTLRASSDAPTHLELYRAWPDVGGVVHTHSPMATAWAQAGREIPPLGTTHADFSPTAIPCTRMLTDKEVREQYEANTGRVIVERFAGMDPARTPAALVMGHGPFVWGPTADEAVTNAGILEQVARMAYETVQLNRDVHALPDYLLAKHFSRKHGPDAYYGQQ